MASCELCEGLGKTGIFGPRGFGCMQLPCEVCKGIGTVPIRRARPRPHSTSAAALQKLRAEFPTWDSDILSDVLRESHGDVAAARDRLCRWTTAQADPQASLVAAEVYPARHPVSPWNYLRLRAQSRSWKVLEGPSSSLRRQGSQMSQRSSISYAGEPPEGKLLRRSQFDRCMVRRLERGTSPEATTAASRAAAHWKNISLGRSEGESTVELADSHGPTDGILTPPSPEPLERLPSPVQDEALRKELLHGLSPEQRIEVGRRRLRERCEFLSVQTLKVGSDGNCQFRALSHELFGTQERHAEVRARVVQVLRERSDEFGALFDRGQWEPFLEDMATLGTWGDELTLRAAAQAYGVRLHVVTSDEDNWYLQYAPEGGKPDGAREVFLTYIAPVHYNCFLPLR